MRPILVLLLSFASSVVYSQNITNKFDLKDFIPFESSELVFDRIVTDNEYLYWRCSYSDMFMGKKQEKLIAQSGDKKYARQTRKKFSQKGFLVDCGPAFCYYYIVAVRKDKTIEIVDTDEKLKSFVGRVDNIEEVKLLTRANRLYINLKNRCTGSYLKIGDDYLLYLFDHIGSCLPGDISDEQSIKALLTAKGEFSLISRKFYNRK